MKLFKIEAGTFHCDGGAIFGVVPKKVWQKRYPCNIDNFCKMTMRCLLIDTDEKVIIVDTGTGTKQLEYLQYYHFKDIIDFETELNKLGYRCSDVTDVVHTHLHFDHCGSSTCYNADHSELSLTFPNADYWVGKKQWENFKNPNIREGDSFFPENMLLVEKARKLRLIDYNHLLTPEIELRLFHGHTVGQIVPYIHTERRTFVYVGDVIPLAASIPIAWISAYDTYPIKSMEEKELLLSEVAEKNQLLIFEHDAFVEICSIKNMNGKYRINEVYCFNENKQLDF